LETKIGQVSPGQEPVWHFTPSIVHILSQGADTRR